MRPRKYRQVKRLGVVVKPWLMFWYLQYMEDRRRGLPFQGKLTTRRTPKYNRREEWEER